MTPWPTTSLNSGKTSKTERRKQVPCSISKIGPWFPFLLFLIGVAIVAWVIRETYRQRTKEKISAEKIIETLPETVKKSGLRPDDVPFEIVFKEEGQINRS